MIKPHFIHGCQRAKKQSDSCNSSKEAREMFSLVCFCAPHDNKVGHLKKNCSSFRELSRRRRPKNWASSTPYRSSTFTPIPGPTTDRPRRAVCPFFRDQRGDSSQIAVQRLTTRSLKGAYIYIVIYRIYFNIEFAFAPRSRMPRAVPEFGAGGTLTLLPGAPAGGARAAASGAARAPPSQWTIPRNTSRHRSPGLRIPHLYFTYNDYFFTHSKCTGT
ncbi:hypothetical protein EVAR_40646_1 [Eumeta japonica]|uniref:Uncharacterized protein n=1 Tax=Eumeta variegata TaxID=151549 RepID=A0A4C1X4N0_EUMVA|nr:hypothetical protein EVAR_40646_1 [Eumeta japonica]